MSFGSYSTTPASNISCNGINIAENCAAANMNDVVRQIMADGRELYDIVAGLDVSGYLPLAGGTVTGAITRSGAGPHLYHVNSAFASGGVYTQQQAVALPSSPAEGSFLFTYL